MADDADYGAAAGGVDGASSTPYGRATSSRVYCVGGSVESLTGAVVSQLMECHASAGSDEFGAGGSVAALAVTLNQATPGASASLSSSSSSSWGAQRELGDGAVWSLSSCKAGNGVEQLRDGDSGTFWQSDGATPHAIQIYFHKQMRVSAIALYLDSKLDESYSPTKLSIRVGHGAPASGVVSEALLASLNNASSSASSSAGSNVQEVERFELESPQGWIVVMLHEDDDGADPDAVTDTIHAAVRCNYVQILVLASQQNGRDCHVRQVRVFGPQGAPAGRGLLDEMWSFSSPQMRMHAFIR